MTESSPRERSHSTEQFTFNDRVIADFQLTKKQLEQIEKRLDRVENRLERLEVRTEARFEKIDEKMDKLADKIDELRKEMKSSSNHGQISNITTIGIAIAVIYSLLR